MLRSLLVLALTFGLSATVADAQPFDAWLTMLGNPSRGYVNIPDHPSLNPTGALTIEAWVNISNNLASEDCRSIIGKNWEQSWWLGLCTVGGQPTLRTYLRGLGSAEQGGVIPPGLWTHIAVVFNGTRRLHYINGEKALDVPEPGGPLPVSPAQPMRIGHDIRWEHTPAGAIDEVRLWNVARTQAQIRANLNKRISTAQPGLVAVWALNANGNDIIGARDGNLQGVGVGFLTFPPSLGCGATTPTTLCLHGGRFSITSKWRTSPAGTAPNGNSTTVNAPNPGSGLFWFFNAENWEVLVKVLNACGLNDRWWVFFAATTNVHYRLDVYDHQGREQKIYFNYPGPPAPAVNDTDAFDTCP
jgi:hypothetical protein